MNPIALWSDPLVDRLVAKGFSGIRLRREIERRLRRAIKHRVGPQVAVSVMVDPAGKIKVILSGN